MYNMNQDFFLDVLSSQGLLCSLTFISLSCLCELLLNDWFHRVLCLLRVSSTFLSGSTQVLQSQGRHSCVIQYFLLFRVWDYFSDRPLILYMNMYVYFYKYIFFLSKFESVNVLQQDYCILLMNWRQFWFLLFALAETLIWLMSHWEELEKLDKKRFEKTKLFKGITTLIYPRPERLSSLTAGKYR